MLALHYCTDSVTHATSLAFAVRYADALRRCVTVGYGCALRCVTLMRYGVSRWRVTAVCYCALRRYVTVRYGALL